MIPKTMREPDGLRGLVPSRVEGYKDRVYGEYMRSLNARDNPDLHHALALHIDPRFQTFLERLKNKSFKRISVQTIAKQCGISLLDFQNWWNRATSQQAIAIAQQGSMVVVEDMVEDAKSSKVACPRCDGLTWISAPPGLDKKTPGYRLMEEGNPLENIADKYIRDCPECNDGTVRKPGDAHARDRVLEVSGLITRGKGVAVNINQNFAGQTHTSAVSDLDKAMTIDLSADPTDSDSSI